MAKAPLVSIAMPVRNAGPAIQDAIISILWQSFSDWELLVIDDGSSDSTVDLASRFDDSRIKIVSDGHWMGLPARLNQAIMLSRGTLFARMDADDISYPERLERQLEFAEKHPEVDLLGCGMLVFHGDGVPLGVRVFPETHEQIAARPANGFPMGHPTFFGKLDAFRGLQYRPDKFIAQDQDFLARAYKRQLRFGNVGQVLFAYREEKLKLKRTISGRLELAESFGGTYLRHKNYTDAFKAAGLQIAKIPVDITAIATGLDYALLRHRARKITTEQSSEWAKIWADLLERRAGINSSPSIDIPG